MEVVVNDQQKLLREAAINRAKSRVNASFAKFGDQVKSIVITVEDVNGPRGGIDKACRVLVKLRKLNDVVVTAKDETVARAIPGAIDRASRSVARLLDRRLRMAKASRSSTKA